MALEQLIPLAIKISIFLVVFALGLKTHGGDAVYLLRRPWLLARSLLSMSIAMVVAAVAISALFDLPFPVEVALIALAASPVPPILPAKQAKAGGSASYSIALLAAAAIASIVLAPLAVSLAGAFFGRETAISSAAVGKIVLLTVLVPLGLGIAARMTSPDWAERAARPLSIAGTAVLVLSILPVLFLSTGAIWELVGRGVAAALAAFTLIGLAVGHVLGGPEPENRTVLALATGTRHPGVAIAVASVNFPEEKAVLAVVLYHLVIGAIVSVPYVGWRRRQARPAE